MGTEVATKWVYEFSEGSRDMRDLLGGKGANVAEMTRVLGPERVPAGFTITTEACVAYMRDGGFPDGLEQQVAGALSDLEEQTGKKLGDPGDPLLVSVRSGARESMPGMLDTVLNLGLNDESVQGLTEQTDNERFAWDSYRRFVQMYATSSRASRARRSRREIKRLKADRESRTTPSSTPAPCARSSTPSRACTARRPARTSRRTRRTSSRARSAPSSTPGTASAPSPTGASTASPTTGGPR